MGFASRLTAFPCLLSFLTRIPGRCHDVRRAAYAFPLAPLVGLVEGLLLSLLASMMHCSPRITGALLLVAHLMLTGGIHMEGFADYSDAVGAGARGNRALELLKDPRRGGFAVIFTAVLVIAKYAGYASLAEKPLALLSPYVASTEAMYIASIILPSANAEGLGMLFKKLGAVGDGVMVNIVAFALSSLTVVWLLPQDSLIALSTGVLAGLLAAIDALKRIGRVSGDALGFVYEVSNTASILGVAAHGCAS
ncbi:MAG: hypothetical protein DSY37_02500 [Hyperthermus sp.]|nr:MAG: hypothetical protein DSY37_02500 [Hyperthermus sp.]